MESNVAKCVTTGEVNTKPTYELQNTHETTVNSKNDTKKNCNKCSMSKNCFKNYVNNSSKKDKLSSLMLAPKMSDKLKVHVEIFPLTDIDNQTDESNKISANKYGNKRSVSKSLEEKQFRSKIPSKKHKNVNGITEKCGGPVTVNVNMVPLQDITDQRSKEESELRRSSDKVRRQKKCEIRLNRIKLSSRKCDIKISSIDLKRHLQKKKSRVSLKRLKLPHGLGSKIASDNNNSRFNNRIGLNHLKPNPKTLKERKTNDEILRHFSQDHCDDMFEARVIPGPSYVSKLNLMESSFASDSSDGEDSSDNQPHTPLAKHLAQFGGWSAETPEHIRGESEEGEGTEMQGGQCQVAFVHKSLEDRMKAQRIRGKRISSNLEDMKNSVVDLDSVFGSDKCSTPTKSSRPPTLKDFLGELEPALENHKEPQQDMEEDEVEPYFEEF